MPVVAKKGPSSLPSLNTSQYQYQYQYGVGDVDPASRSSSGTFNRCSVPKRSGVRYGTLSRLSLLAWHSRYLLCTLPYKYSVGEKPSIFRIPLLYALQPGRAMLHARELAFARRSSLLCHPVHLASGRTARTKSLQGLWLATVVKPTTFHPHSGPVGRDPRSHVRTVIYVPLPVTDWHG